MTALLAFYFVVIFVYDAVGHQRKLLGLEKGIKHSKKQTRNKIPIQRATE
jgi:hypothetical protein